MKLFNNKLRSEENEIILNYEKLITNARNVLKQDDKTPRVMHAVFLLYMNDVPFSVHSTFFFSEVNENIVGTALSTNFALVGVKSNSEYKNSSH